MTHPDDNDAKSSRRDWLKLASIGAVLGMRAAAAPPNPAARSMIGERFAARDVIRLGFAGVGGRGTSLLRNFLAIDKVEVRAVCDLARDHAARAARLVEEAGQKAPELYTAGERDFENLSKRDDLELVIIASPWDWHVPMALAAMRNGKHAAVEVPAAVTLEDCWQLVDTSEKTRRHCIMLENCCYGFNEMMVLSMVRDGVFGELTHGAAAYNHDLRKGLLAGDGEGLWRRKPHLTKNGNLYPTHGLGPVANYMDINRGDRFTNLVSMSSPAKSLAFYRANHIAAGDPKSKEVYRCGDLNTSLIQTANGLLVTLEHNVTTPQPYDRINLIAGTKGVFRDYPPRIFLDGESKGDQWESIDPYKARYEHPLWTRLGELARKLGGHGGMDFLMCYRLVQAVREGSAPDLDVYDAAAWSAPGPLSEMSVARGGAPVPFPDFTHGRWRQARKEGRIS